MIRLGVLGSTRGGDLVPIVEAINSGKLRASVEVIISNNKNSLILEKAEKYKIPSAFISHKGKERLVFGREVDKKLSEKKVDLVLLIGFMRI